MRKMVVVCVMMLCWCAPVHADMWDLYDGDGSTAKGKYYSQQGLNCDAYNYMAGLKWRHKGGDWSDENGIAQGPNPHTSIRLAASKLPKRVSIDYTPLIGAAGVVFRRTPSAIVRLATRENAAPPVLRLTMADGSVRELPAIADAPMIFASPGKCSSAAVGRGTSAIVGPAAVMGFGAIPEGAVSAALEITVLSVSTRTTLQLYALSVPRTEVWTMAPPVADDPGYLWRVTFDEHERPCDKWWEPGQARKPTSQWKQDGGLWIVPGSSGVWCANGDPTPVKAQGTTDTMVQRGTGAVGNGVMFSYHPTVLAAGTDMVGPNLRKLNGLRDLDEGWLTYWVKFGEDFHSFARCEGGKLPGLTGRTQPTGTFCGNSSRDANGLCGWSLRMSWKMQCDPANPAWGRIEVYTYAYHGRQPGFYGQTWGGNEKALLELGKWHCVEQYVRVNTPGVADGENTVYIDGVRAIHKTGVYLRGVKPAQGYGRWKLASRYPMPADAIEYVDAFGRKLWASPSGPFLQSTDLGISGVWWVQHGGGVTPPGKTAQMWQDELSFSHRRAGCPERTAP